MKLGVKKKCFNCNLEIIVKRRLKDKNFCSKSCAGKSRQRRVILNCSYCNKKMSKVMSAVKKYGGKLFCSRNCLAKFQVGPNNPRYIYVNKKCKICEKQIPHERALRPGTVCCSKECKIKSYTGKLHYLWNGGVSFKEYPSKFNKYLKEKIKTRDGWKCQGCGKTQEQEKKDQIRGLSVHHIDSNKDNCDINNLITTCRKCNNGAKKMRDYWYHFYKHKLWIMEGRI